MRVLFVGPLSGFTSYPVVCKGLVQALTSAGLELDIADTTWDGSPDHTAPHLMGDDRSIRFLDRKEVMELVQQGKHSSGGGGICVAVNPSHHMMGIKDKGYKLAGMFVGDVDKIPGSWQTLMEQQDVILTPSSWGEHVIRKARIEKDVLVCNHGVSPIFQPDPSVTRADYSVIFFHACSAIYYPERKGTPQLLEAFSKLAGVQDNVRLRLFLGGKTKPIQKMLRALDKSVLDKIEIYFREGAREPAEICYDYQTNHVGIFPSRAEGMGMMPIEMRACGMPVIQTMCTGHADHLDPSLRPRSWGIEVIHHGEMIEAWGSFGKAPMVQPDWIYDSMLNFLTFRDTITEAAQSKADVVRQMWSWEETTAPLVDWIRSAAK